MDTYILSQADLELRRALRLSGRECKNLPDPSMEKIQLLIIHDRLQQQLTQVQIALGIKRGPHADCIGEDHQLDMTNVRNQFIALNVAMYRAYGELGLFSQSPLVDTYCTIHPN